MFVNVNELLGKTIERIDNNDHEELVFHTTDGEVFKMHHRQDCCEWVRIEDIVGDLEDLIGSPITMAEEVEQSSETSWGSQTWTFYNFATIKGYVTLRWLGESNGYYSEAVSFIKIK